MNIVLIGFMATGKTILGKLLAERLNMKFIDTDVLIEENEGKKISKIFEKEGEKYFRNLEKEVIKKVSRKNNTVISTGGGVVLLPENIERLKRKGIIICLKTRPEVILERIKLQKGIRPLLNKPEPLKEIKSILKKRAPYYKQADFTIDTSDFEAEKIIDRISGKILNKF
ncbi:MAG: shikimate kinase [bacterium]|nr:shikimate kinase [bacterium]